MEVTVYTGARPHFCSGTKILGGDLIKRGEYKLLVPIFFCDCGSPYDDLPSDEWCWVMCNTDFFPGVRIVYETKTRERLIYPTVVEMFKRIPLMYERMHPTCGFYHGIHLKKLRDQLRSLPAAKPYYDLLEGIREDRLVTTTIIVHN